MFQTGSVFVGDCALLLAAHDGRTRAYIPCVLLLLGDQPAQNSAAAHRGSAQTEEICFRCHAGPDNELGPLVSGKTWLPELAEQLKVLAARQRGTMGGAREWFKAHSVHPVSPFWQRLRLFDICLCAVNCSLHNCDVVINTCVLQVTGLCLHNVAVAARVAVWGVGRPGLQDPDDVL